MNSREELRNWVNENIVLEDIEDVEEAKGKKKKSSRYKKEMQAAKVISQQLNIPEDVEDIEEEDLEEDIDLIETISNMSDEEYDEFLEALSDEELEGLVDYLDEEEVDETIYAKTGKFLAKRNPLVAKAWKKTRWVPGKGVVPK